MKTQIHTYFWTFDDLVTLYEEAKKLRDDYKDRFEDNTYMSTELQQAAKDRIDNLDIAIRLMGDKAD